MGKAENQPLLPGSNSTRPSAKRKYLCLPKLTLILLALIFFGSAYRTLFARGKAAHRIKQPSRTDNPAYLVKAYHGVVASENRVCSDIGVQILKDGGNALDAAIAASLCVGVVNPFSSGIGGGGFMTVRIPPSVKGGRSEVWSIDFREAAPGRSSTTMFEPGTNSSRIGGLAVAVPSELRGFEEAHRRWGSLPWKDLFQPSITLAKGFHIGPELGRRIPWFSELLLNNPDWRALYAPEGRLLRTNEILRNVNLSRTLTTIANEGPDAFYKGPIASSIIKKVQATGGILTQEDLDRYSVDVYRSLKGNYKDKTVYVTRAPTSGPVLLHMLNIIQHYDFSKHNGVNTHRIVEALKFGFAARTRLSDPDPQFRNDTSIINEIPSQRFAKSILANLTDDRTHTAEYYNPIFDVKLDNGTQHVSAVDQHGMAVAMTSSVNGLFGSYVMDPDTGIIFNNVMDDFSVPDTPNYFGLWPSPFNYPEPYKRPLSSIVPTIIEHSDGSFHVATGASGGSLIFGSVFQVLINLLHWDMNVCEATEAGRVHNQLYPALTVVDNIYEQDLVEDLVSRGHNITILDVNRVAGVVNTVVRDVEGVLYAASDSRKNGIAAGY